LSRVVPLVVFGITLFVGGLYWAVWDGSRSFIDFLVINDVYYELAFFIWRMLPVVMLIIGILCLILAGVSASGDRGVVVE